ncbi:hypothetical protein [Pyxidicoccus trucidator]|uniref:hypothetical protein n=1 Tax=Pyxidicoccus trucidator TaxID=2709662 RepID=UPI0013DC4132|nr:hypothetical protein [Pyxidicoccus trucidator]
MGRGKELSLPSSDKDTGSAFPVATAVEGENPGAESGAIAKVMPVKSPISSASPDNDIFSFIEFMVTPWIAIDYRENCRRSGENRKP